MSWRTAPPEETPHTLTAQTEPNHVSDVTLKTRGGLLTCGQLREAGSGRFDKIYDDLWHLLVAAVSGQDSQCMLHRARRDPDIVCGNWRAGLTKTVEDQRIAHQTLRPGAWHR